MLPRFLCNSVFHYAITASLLGLLTACGGGDGSPTSILPTSIAISGSVGDGPITGATITVMDAYGAVIATTISDETANYTVDIPDDAAFPLIITTNDGTDMVSGTTPDFEMISVITDASEKNANINPFSTMIVKTAQSMQGGLNATNLDLAIQVVIKHLNFGLDTNLVPNPITTVINELNVATIVKSSEVIAEMLRRTRKSLLTSGNTLSEDDLMDSLAADLSDGVIDGVGLASADPLIAAAVNIVSGQVLIEALNNNLYVNEAPATTLMDNAIRITTPEATDTTWDAKITREMLDQAKAAVNSASKMSTPAAFLGIMSALDEIQPGTTPEAINAVLPSERSGDLDNVITLVAYATETEQEDLNTATRLYLETTQAPMLSLTASETDIDANGYVTLTWATSNATSCEASGPVNWNANGAISGEEIVGPLSTNTTLTLICSNDSPENISHSLTINILANAAPDSDNIANNLGTEEPVSSSPADTSDPGDASTAPDDLNQNPDTTSATSATGSVGGSTSNQEQTDSTSSAGNTSPPENTSNNTSSQLISLNWNPNPGSIVGYIVYFGPTAETATTELSNIPVNSTGFDPQVPSMQYDAMYDLGLQSGDDVCFKLRAYNNEGASDWSPAVCSVIGS